jgi:hypothetical protein
MKSDFVRNSPLDDNVANVLLSEGREIDDNSREESCSSAHQSTHCSQHGW